MAVSVLDEFSLKNFPPAGISFAEIANFKGLENEAVILVDLPKPTREGRSSVSHYVGMGRGRAILWMVFRKQG